MSVAGTDGFNWGYDPMHYTTPEGSYATDPNGATRTLQFREMVAALNSAFKQSQCGGKIRMEYDTQVYIVRECA